MKSILLFLVFLITSLQGEELPEIKPFEVGERGYLHFDNTKNAKLLLPDKVLGIPVSVKNGKIEWLKRSHKCDSKEYRISDNLTLKSRLYSKNTILLISLVNKENPDSEIVLCYKTGSWCKHPFYLKRDNSYKIETEPYYTKYLLLKFLNGKPFISLKFSK